MGSLVQGLGGWGGVMSVCVLSLDSLSRWQVQVSVYIVLGGFLRILGAPSVQPVAPYRYLLPNLYLSVADIAMSILGWVLAWCYGYFL